MSLLVVAHFTAPGVTKKKSLPQSDTIGQCSTELLVFGKNEKLASVSIFFLFFGQTKGAACGG